MKPTKHLIEKYPGLYDYIFIHNGKYWFMKEGPGSFYVIPAVGDIVEYQNGERNIVLHVEAEAGSDGGVSFDIRASTGVQMVLARKGRSTSVLTITYDQDEEWSLEDARLIRDGTLIYPVSRYFYLLNNFIIFKNNLPNKVKHIVALSKAKLLNIYNATTSMIEGIKKKLKSTLLKIKQVCFRKK